MKKFNNNQWDDKYPVTEHFEKDIETETLYVLDVDSKIYGFIVIDQTQSEWYDDIEWPVNREGAYVIHRLAGSKDYKGAATELFQFAVDLTEEHGIHVILTDTFALNKPAQNLLRNLDLLKLEKQKWIIILSIEAHHFTLIIKNIGIEVVTMSKIAFTGGGTVGHVSVNLSLIPTAVEKGHEAFYIGSKQGIERDD